METTDYDRRFRWDFVLFASSRPGRFSSFSRRKLISACCSKQTVSSARYLSSHSDIRRFTPLRASPSPLEFRAFVGPCGDCFKLTIRPTISGWLLYIFARLTPAALQTADTDSFLPSVSLTKKEIAASTRSRTLSPPSEPAYSLFIFVSLNVDWLGQEASEYCVRAVESPFYEQTRLRA